MAVAASAAAALPRDTLSSNTRTITVPIYSELDTGAVYERVLANALDGGFQVGLTHDAPAFSAFGGVSVIVGNILGGHGGP